jgi:hypothetical protein
LIGNTTVSDKPISYVPGRVPSEFSGTASAWLRSEFNRIRDWIVGSDDRMLSTESQLTTLGEDIDSAEDRLDDAEDRLDDAEDRLDSAEGLLANRGWRNWILNGEFWSADRGSSWTTCVFNTPGPNRWLHMCGGSGQVVNITLESFGAGEATPVLGWNPKGYLRYRVVTPGPSDGNHMRLGQVIENLRNSDSRTITVSAWFRSRSASADSVRLHIGQNFGTGGSADVYLSSPLTAIPNDVTWKRVEFTATLPSMSGKTLGTDHGTNVLVEFSQGNKVIDIDCTGVQFEYASEASAYEVRSQHEEQLALMRYFWTTKAPESTGVFLQMGALTGTGTAAFNNLVFPVPMRSLPAVTAVGQSIVSPVSGGTTTYVVDSKRWRPNLAGGTGGTAYQSAIYLATEVKFDAEMLL